MIDGRRLYNLHIITKGYLEQRLRLLAFRHKFRAVAFRKKIMPDCTLLLQIS